MSSAARLSSFGAVSPPDAAASGGAFLSAEGLRKGFFGQTVLDGVSLQLRAGEIRALLGENGAGKSTLINLISGALVPDGGSLSIDGEPVRFSGPLSAWQAGIATIRQEFSLFPELSVAETVFAGHLPRNRLGLVDWPAMRRRAGAALARLGLEIAPGRRIATLSVAEQQLVEIARALTFSARLIIMDEPTASLSPAEVERLKAIVRAVAAEGVAVLYVSHRLEEVKDLCHTYTVLRDGRFIAEGALETVAVADLVRFMVGRDLEPPPPRTDRRGAPVLQVSGLAGDPASPRAALVRDVGFTLHAGEIVGLAGLVGAGRTEIARMLFGVDPRAAGTLALSGAPFSPRTPQEAIAAGVALVPEDRKQQALFLSLAVAENFALAGGVPGRFGLIDRPAERRRLADFAGALNLKAPRFSAPVATLSGGNQQKVVLARWMALDPKVLIVDEPTRGVDIAAKADVHRLIRDAAGRGMAVLVISSDLPEVLALSDRILTLAHGRLTGEVAGGDATEEGLMRLMTVAP